MPPLFKNEYSPELDQREILLGIFEMLQSLRRLVAVIAVVLVAWTLFIVLQAAFG